MDVKFIIFIFFFTICTTQAFHTLIPEGKELVYEYEGTISASTHIPRPYTSTFTLLGDLHVQRDNQSVFVKFSDLTYKLYNGLEDDYESKILPVPEEIEAFSKTFRIDYQTTGEIAGIAAGKDEKQYVVNFKKGISSMLQLNLEMIEKNDNGDVYAFQTVENTVYGEGKVDYTVQVVEDGLHVDVMQTPHCTRNLYTHLISNVESVARDFEQPLSRESRRSCVLGNKGKTVESIRQIGGISNTPFNGQGEAHVIFTEQGLVLKSTKAISSRMEVGDEIYHKDLVYHVADLDSDFPDVTNGRRRIRKEVNVDQAIALIAGLIDYVFELEIDDKRPDFRKAQILDKILSKMASFDESMLDEMYGKLSNSDGADKDKYLSVYRQLMILLGTHASYRHIIKLNNEETLDQSFAYDMFANVKYPNKKLVDEMAAILTWESRDYHPTVYSAAVLSFGTLLSKAVERNRRYGRQRDNKFEEEYPDHEYYEKYVVDLVGKLKAAEKYEDRMLYLLALHNTKMESIVQHLQPAVNGEWWKEADLRMMAAFVINPIVAKSEELTFKTYWPFMINTAIPSSFRIMSYYRIMQSRPSLPRLANIYWVMESMKNHELYTFHYEYITALSQTENPRDRRFIVHLKQILQYTAKPVFRGLTEYHHFDYFNQAYSFGEEMDLMTLHSKRENDIVLAGSYQSSEDGLTTPSYWVYLRLSGFPSSLLQALKLDTTSKTFLFTWETLANVILNIDKSEDAKVTFIFAKNGRVMTSHAFDKHNVKTLAHVFKALINFRTIKNGGIDVSYELFKTINLATDLGFPAILLNRVPNIDHTSFLITREGTDDDQVKLSFDLLYKSSRNSGRGLSFYNPVLDVYQGVGKLHFLDRKFQFRCNASIDTVGRTLKMNWEKEETPYEPLFAERSYADTMVYVRDAFRSGILQKSNSDCKNFEFVSFGGENKTRDTTGRFPLVLVETNVFEAVFDQEQPLPKELNLIKSVPDVTDHTHYLKSLMQSRRFEKLQPKDIHYGVVRRVQADYPVEKIDLTLKLDAEYKKGNDYLYPAVAYKMKFHYFAGTNNATFTVGRVEAKLEMDDGHMNNVFSARVILGDAERTFCAEGDSVWSADPALPGFESNVYLSANILEGELCGKNNSLVTIQIRGEKSEEQEEGDHSYHSCYENVIGPIEKQKSLDCLFAYDSLRKYNITLKNFIPEDKNNRLLGIISEGLLKLSSDSVYIATLYGIKSNEMRILFYLPMGEADSLKLYMYTEDSGRSYEISNELVPGGANMVYGSMFEFMHDYGLTDVCVIDNHKGKLVPNDWSLFLGTSKTGPKFEIWMKSPSGGNNMVLKFVFKTHTLLVEPKDGKYVFTVDGEEMNAETASYSNKWLSYAWVKDTRIVSIYVKNIGIHTIYNGHQASIEYPQIEGIEMHGHCLDRV